MAGAEKHRNGWGAGLNMRNNMYDEIINEIMRKAKMEGFLVFVGVPLEDANLR